MKYLPSSRFSCAKEHQIWHHSCCMLLRTAFRRNQQCLGAAYTAANIGNRTSQFKGMKKNTRRISETCLVALMVSDEDGHSKIFELCTGMHRNNPQIPA